MKRHILFLFLLIFLFAITSSAQSLRTLHEKTFDVKSGELLEVESDVGDFKIKTWDKDQVYIKVYGDDDAEDDVEFKFEKTSRGVLIDADLHRGWNWFSNVRVKYEINLPSNFDVNLLTAGGDIVLSDLSGNMELKTSGGDVHIYNTTGDLTVGTSGGDVDVKEAEGELNVSTSGGDVFIKSTNGYVSAKTSGGDIELNYSGLNQGIELGTSGGDITVYIPDDFRADVYLRTSGGDIETDFVARVQEVDDSKFIGQMNDGGRELNCRTSGGDIIVKTY